MLYHYTKIEDLVFNDKPLYFRTPLTKELTRATTFSEKYLYYHSYSSTVNSATVNSESDIKTLGKFITVSRRNSGSIYDDYDYSVYEFELGIVNCKLDGRTDGDIYLIGIPDSDEGMTPMENMLYRGWPVFYNIC
jgi:hypothetical protein